MNEDDYFHNYIKNHNHNWSYTLSQTKMFDPNMTTKQLYDLLNQVENYHKKEADMSWGSYNRGYYEDITSKEVATAVLEAYSNGIDFETLVKNNKQVRTYWKLIQAAKVKKAQANERQKIRLAKLAEKKAEETAKREEVMSKLTPEELEAFGFAKNPRKVTKR